MAQEDKELLLKDLCARLPYGVHCCVLNLNKTIKEDNDIIYGIVGDNIVTLQSDKNECYMHYQVKPYLRPMSSMTEEENIERKKLGILLAFGDNHKTIFSGFGAISGEDIIKCFDWLNAHHFDFRNLISKGLAIEAPDGMYNLNEK